MSEYVAAPPPPIGREPSSRPPHPTDLWKQYEVHVDLYKFYIGVMLKLNGFYYLLTGLMVSYYLSRPEGYLRLSLVLPALIGFALFAVSVYGGVLNLNTRRDIRGIVARLHMRTAPEFLVLSVLLWVSAALVGIVVAGLLTLIAYPDLPSGRYFR